MNYYMAFALLYGSIYSCYTVFHHGGCQPCNGRHENGKGPSREVNCCLLSVTVSHHRWNAEIKLSGTRKQQQMKLNTLSPPLCESTADKDLDKDYYICNLLWCISAAENGGEFRLGISAGCFLHEALGP